MEAYEGFAKVYDIFMKETPYEQWADYIEEIWKRNNFKPELVLDLACGTGNITMIMDKKGYDMIGIDNSFEMLSIAKEKNKDILYICQDMREFELYGTVDAITCICDGINYLIEDNDLLQVLYLVKNYLNPGGYFIFDINTIYKFKHILGENCFVQTENNSSYIWENYYYEDEKINEYTTTFFIERPDNLYEKITELHYQKAYSILEIKKLVKQSGLILVDYYDELTFNKPNSKSSRIFFVVKK